MRLQSRYWLGLHSSESLTGARGSISNIAHLFGYWQEAPVPYPMDLTIGLLECARDKAAGFPQSG